MTTPSDETFALIEQIQKHPYIYNYTLPEYARKDIVEVAWNDVAEHMCLTVSECKDKWRNIRTCLLRDLKKAKKCKNSNKPRRPYYLRESLEFLVPFIKCGPSEKDDDDDILYTNDEFEDETSHVIITNPSTSKKVTRRYRNRSVIEKTKLDYDDEENIDDQHSLNNASTSSKDRKRPLEKPYVEHLNVKRLTRNYFKTPMYHFMLSLLPEFNTMTEQQIRHFKIEVMLLIDKIKSSQESSDEGEDPLQATSSSHVKDEDSS